MRTRASSAAQSRRVLTYVTAQGGVGFGRFDLGEVLGQRVLMFGLFVAFFVVQLKDTYTIMHSWCV